MSSAPDHAWRILLILLTFVLALSLGAPAQPEGATAQPVPAMPCQSLAGEHRFAFGDDPAWARPDFDDHDWAVVHVPGDLGAQDVHGKPGIGWYRLRFFADPFWLGQPLALALGRVGNADEVYLNGVYIGGEGVVGDAFVEAPWKNRLYPIAPGLPRFDRENVLAVRILDTYRMAGIFQGPVCIGDLPALLVEHTGRQFERKAVEIAFVTLLGFFLLLSLFMTVHQPHASDYAAFALFLAVYLGMFVLESVFVYELGMKTPLVQRVILALACLLPAAGLCFFVRFLRHQTGWPFRLVVGLSLALAALMLLPMRLEAYFLLFDLAGILIALTACLGLAVVVVAVRRGHHDAWLLLLGGAGFTTGLIFDFIPAEGHWHALPVQPADLGMTFLMLVMAYALAARFARSTRQVRALSGRILEVHEQERKRLARNLHDGLGQFLSALKLRLQMLEARHGAGQVVQSGEIRELVSEAASASVELREIVTDLRPQFLEQSPLPDVLRWYGQGISRRTGLDVRVAVSEGYEGQDDLPVRLKDNLYRICQEALHNVVKHAGAGRVDIGLHWKRSLIMLTISDDGQGFDPATAAQGRGVGLLSMRERAELLGGRFMLRGAPGRGCRIQVEAPIP